MTGPETGPPGRPGNGLAIRSVQPSEMALLAALQSACFVPFSDPKREGRGASPAGESRSGGARPSESCPGESPSGESPSGASLSYVGVPWSARSWAEILAMPGSFALLAVAGDEPVGFLTAQILFENCQLLSLGVLPAHRRAGCGRRLVEQLVGVAGRQGVDSIQLEVAENNRRARAFYEGLGFTLAGRRSGYYRGPDGAALDALILARSLVAA